MNGTTAETHFATLIPERNNWSFGFTNGGSVPEHNGTPYRRNAVPFRQQTGEKQLLI
jgi:hypothetical protein